MATPPPPYYISSFPPPFINIPLLPNLRDAGGYSSTLHPNRSTTRCTVRKRLLYRSADPSRIRPAILNTLHKDLGITTIFDLRSQPEIEKAASLPSWESRLEENGNIKRRWTPVFKTEDYTPTAIALRFKQYGSSDGTNGFVKAYTAILENAGAAVSEVLRYLASESLSSLRNEVAKADGLDDDKGRQAILVHCSAGKDRAGCLVAVVLGLLGVPDEVVAEEYALTDVGMGPMKGYLVQRLLSSGMFDGNLDPPAAAERMVAARKENMLATLEMVRERWGGMEEYVKEVAGVDDEVIAGVRKNCLVSVEDRNHVIGEECDRAVL
jgi:protein tyrosine/serine phosphatase